ncbi:hypothetical protein V8F20_004106 [Naviculisporaceae sp. PSN 640]
MDPLTALSLASSIAQLLSLAASVSKAVNEIAGAGKTADVAHLQNIVEDFAEANSCLQSHYLPLRQQARSPEQEALSDLCIECTEVAHELSACLSRVCCGTGSNAPAFASLRAAFRTIWIKGEIDRLARRLSEYRSELTLRLLVVINSLIRSQREEIATVRDEITEVLSINASTLQRSLDEHHFKTISAILTTRSGQSTSIGDPGADKKTGVIKAATSTLYSACGDSDDSTVEHEPHFRINNTIPDYCSKISDALHFREISQRWSTISKAHDKTFQWVWKSEDLGSDGHSTTSATRKRKWDNLSEWLQKGQGCYWVCGKAGSGKSSLMKYIQSHENTTALLRDWAGDSNLVIGTFYFWYAGSELQRSQDGLLRSLLLCILRKCPQLALLLFPDLCRSIITREVNNNLAISSSELRLAFQNLLHRPDDGLRIFFMVDGLDEYSGDHNLICDIFASVSESQTVKALISSRPIPACVDRFGDYHKLRLQDLTEPDIVMYASSMLLGNPLMQKMNTLEPGITNKLIKLVSSRAQGVFLWVILVMKSIQRSLQRFDTSVELLKQVERLPQGLDELFDHMFKSIDKDLHLLASKFIQVLLRSITTIPEHPISILQLAFIEEPDDSVAEAAPVQPLSEDAAVLLCERAEGRLRSCCCGLIEVQGSDTPADDARPAILAVGFIHRTVVEFLESNPSWHFLTDMATRTGFDVDRCILASSVRELKSTPMLHRAFPGQPTAITLATCRILKFSLAAKAEVQGYAKEIRTVLAHHWHDDSSFSTPTVELSVYEQSVQKSKLPYDTPRPVLDSFILSYLTQCPDPEFHTAVSEALAICEETNALYFTYLLMVVLQDLSTTPYPVKRTITGLFSGCPQPLITSFRSQALFTHRVNTDFRFQRSQLHSFTAWQYLLFHIISITHPSLYLKAQVTMYTSHPRNWIFLLDITKIFLITADASLDTSTKVSLSASEVREISAAAVILALLNKAWGALGITLQYAEEVAEKAWDIEQYLRENKAQVFDKRDKKSSSTGTSNIKNNSRTETIRPIITGFERLFLKRRPPETNSSTTGDTPTTTETPEGEPGNDQNKLRILTGADFSSLTSDSKSPWNLYLERRCQANRRPSLTNSPGNARGTDDTGPSQWEYTKRTDRVLLLSAEEQKLVHELVKPGLSKKEERKLFGELRGFKGPRQERILECVRVIKSSVQGELDV